MRRSLEIAGSLAVFALALLPLLLVAAATVAVFGELVHWWDVL